MNEQTQQPLFASVDGMAASLSNQECVFQHRQTGQTHVMTHDVLQAMSLCRWFQPLAQHITNIEQQMPTLQGKSEAIAKVLEFLRNRGLMQSADDVLEQMRQQARQMPAASTTHVVIRTCGRPVELARLLASIDDYEGRFNRGLAYLVVDDSRDSADQQSNHGAVEGSQADVRYLGRAWRSGLADRALASGLNAAQLNRLLGSTAAPAGQFTGGQVWNALLLAGAGQGMLMLDDDFLLDFKQRPGTQMALGLSQSAEKIISFAAGSDELNGQLQSFPGDPLALAIDVIGAGTGAIVENGVACTASMLQGMAWTEVDHLLNQSTIKSIECGSWGDMRMDTSMWFYMLPPEQLGQWWRDRASYFHQLKSPTIAHASAQPQLRGFGSFTPLAIDNRELLPPAAPFGRGEDLFFNMTQRFLYPHMVTLDLPWMVGHLRPAGQLREEQPNVYRPWLSRFVSEYALARSPQCEAQSPVARMQHLTSTLRDLAEADSARRRVVMREFLSHIRADVVAGIQQTLASKPDAPAFFQADARDWIEQNGRALTQAEDLRMRDWPADLKADECVDQLQSDLNHYADTLEHWPTLWQWAHEQDDLLTV